MVAVSEALLFENPYFATGLPITEAYWVRIKVAGTVKPVLLQCFERRCLTYTPDNPSGWQVEQGNVGQHYYQWRYAAIRLRHRRIPLRQLRLARWRAQRRLAPRLLPTATSGATETSVPTVTELRRLFLHWQVRPPERPDPEYGRVRWCSD